MENNLFFIISGPSGVGKTLFLNKSLKEFPQLSNTISFTTRPPRKEEKEGGFYYFITREQFKRKKENSEFLEWALVHEEFYATSKTEVEKLWQGGRAIIKDLDVQGFQSIKKIYPQCIGIFIYPPSIDELKRRILNRGAISKPQLEERLSKAGLEMAQGHKYDFKVVNDCFKQAWNEFQNILSQTLKNPLNN